MTISTLLQEKYERLQQLLRDIGRVVIAFSGGVDSMLLLRVALDTLGPVQVLAVIGDLRSVPAGELAEARRLVEEFSTQYRIIAGDEMEDERYTANPPERCFYCKMRLFTKFVELCRQEGYAAVLDGSNADDLDDWRPGSRAARELGVRSPLQEVGLSKAEIRDLSCILGLPTWNKPSGACLATRIPYGAPITPEALSAIGDAELFLRGLGFLQVRVRHHDMLARIEVMAGDIPKLLDEDLRRRVVARLRELGYRYVSVDLQGYRTGSLNETR
ncbi:MAG: ATP-dependent sacrificial sulfur transferase LarE [Armatimonadota bacterium]